MNVRHRPMQLKDIRPCVEHLARHPILRARYGNLIEDLPAAIKGSLRDDYVNVNVFEEFQGSTARFLGAGMAVFVSDDFLREAKATPFLWVGPELVKRISATVRKVDTSSPRLLREDRGHGPNTNP